MAGVIFMFSKKNKDLLQKVNQVSFVDEDNKATRKGDTNLLLGDENHYN